MLDLLLVAIALGLSNLAAAIGIGVSGIGGALRVRVALVFGLFEAGMPLLGFALGHGLADSLGHAAGWLGGALLIAVGGYGLAPARGSARHAPGPDTQWRLSRMALTGLALSIDNLAAGFALGANRAALGVAAALIGAVSVGMSLAGLELGARLGTAIGARSDLAAAGVLVAVGVAMVVAA